MTHPEADSPRASEPLDEADFAILDDLRDVLEAVDPMPADLPQRIRFALALRDLECEVARLSESADLPVLSVRGAEESRTITFDSDSLTIMIRVDPNQDGSVRLDGWLAPAAGRRTIDLTTAADRLTVVTDERGRFVFSRVPRGTAQLVVRAELSQAELGKAVVTPALTL